jgi:hypothetical protein
VKIKKSKAKTDELNYEVVMRKTNIRVEENSELVKNYRVSLDGTVYITQPFEMTGCVMASLTEDEFVKMCLPILEQRLRWTYRNVEVYDRFA